MRLRAAAAVARAQRPLFGDAATLEALLERDKVSQYTFMDTVLSIVTLQQLMAVAHEWGAGDTMLAAQPLLRLPAPHFSLAGLAACGGAAVLLALLAACCRQRGSRRRLRLHVLRRARAQRVAGGLLRSLRDANTKRVDACKAYALQTAWLEQWRTPPPLPPRPITTPSMPTGSARRRRSTVAATSSAAARGSGNGAALQPEPERTGQVAAMDASADAANDAPPPPVLDAPSAAAQPPAPMALPSVPLSPPPPADEDAECALCRNAPREVAFVPCGHRQTCMACAERVLRSGARARCPFCNMRATQAIRIFL